MLTIECWKSHTNLLFTVSLFMIANVASLHGQASVVEPRPMTFLDAQKFARSGSWTPSPDGEWLLHSVTTPDWGKDKSQSDLYLVSMKEGVESTRQLTFTQDKNETSPAWSKDGAFFVFASDRDQTEELRGQQLYMMRPDGGEARAVTDAKWGVADFAFSKDGDWLIYRSGEEGREQLYRLPVDDILGSAPLQVTRGASGVDDWEWSPDSRTVYFTRANSMDEDNRKRLDEGFSVDVKNMVTSLASLWKIAMDDLVESRMTDDDAYSVSSFSISSDGAWIAFAGGSPERYERNITGGRLYTDQYLLEVRSRSIERLTDNYEVGESLASFSPDSRWIAFSAPDDLSAYSMTENRIYLRAVDDEGGTFRKLGSSFDQGLRMGFWSEDSRTIYFNAGVKVATQLHALDIENNRVRQITDEKARLSVNRDADSGQILIGYADPKTPPTLFTTSDIEGVGDRSSWVQLVDVNPQVNGMLLGDQVEVNWTSTDGKIVGGVLVYPVGYEQGERYPLIVAIHGGPAGADQLDFNGGYNSQVYAGAGYAVLRPNYRGSVNYGNAHRTDIVGDYFTLGFDDIMTGVDYLIEEGIVDGDRMGALGWSAGGHWSNWILTHTDRFKAISSGAGTMNWISMYAQSDVQRNRQFYIGDEFLYENFDTYWNQSPLKYIASASTPTMIHVVEGDPRVPSPQSVELHMALKKLHVPTELFMYPGRTHGITQPRNRLVKAVSEKAWMDHYVRGLGNKFEWRQVLETLESESEPKTISEEGSGGK